MLSKPSIQRAGNTALVDILLQFNGQPLHSQLFSAPFCMVLGSLYVIPGEEGFSIKIAGCIIGSVYAQAKTKTANTHIPLLEMWLAGRRGTTSTRSTKRTVVGVNFPDCGVIRNVPYAFGTNWIDGFHGMLTDNSIETATVSNCASILTFHFPHVSERRDFYAITVHGDQAMCSIY